MSNLGPPKHLSDEQLVAQLLERPAPSRVVPFPAKRDIPGAINGEVRLIMIDPVEGSRQKAKTAELVRSLLQSQSDGREITSADMATPHAREMYNDWLTAAYVALATWSVDPVGGTPEQPVYRALFPKGARQVMDPKKGGLYSDEIAILFTSYMTMELELGPRAQVLCTGNDMYLNMWIEKVKAGAWSLDPFSSLASQDLAELCLQALRKIDHHVQSGSITLDLPFSTSPDTSESSHQE